MEKVLETTGVRVLLITQLFDPENAIKGLSFCKQLAELGHDVEVVTTFPNYPGGRLFPGYRMRWLQREQIDGIRIARVPMYMSHTRSSLKRLLGYCSFSFCAFLYAVFGTRRADVIYAYYPPVVGGIMAALLGLLQRRPFIYDVQDLWPEAVVATGMVRSKVIVWLIEGLAKWIYKRAAAVVVLSDGYRDALIGKGVQPEKIARIYNWSDESRLTNHALETATQVGLGTFDIVYAGNMGAAQALSAVLDAAHELQKNSVDQVRFVFVGDGVEKAGLQAQADRLALKNVVFKPRLPPEEIGAELQAASALLVHLAPDPVFSITVPQKLQAYLAAGKPILVGVTGESSEIIRRAGAGVSVRPGDPADIARGVLQLACATPAALTAMGIAGKRFYGENMSQSNGVRLVSETLVHASNGRGCG